jgi:hypothetical protein
MVAFVGKAVGSIFRDASREMVKAERAMMDVNAMQISVKAQTDSVKRWLTDEQKKKFPRVLSQTLNAVAFDAKFQNKTEITKVFDNPVAATKNATWVNKATPKKLFAEVKIKSKDEVGWNVTPSMWLQPQVDGGERVHKSYERALISRGIMNPNQYTVVTGKQNKNGNLTGGRVMKILSQMGAAEKYAGYNANETDASRKRAGSRRERYVAINRGGRPIGIFVRKGRNLENVLAFVNSPPMYQERFDFYGVSMKSYDKNFERQLAYWYNRILDVSIVPF